MTQQAGRASRLDLVTLLEQGTLAGLTDGQLLERCGTGNGAAAEMAFALLVERHGSMVLHACRGILRDEHEAMDAFQATFLVLARKARSLWVRDSLGPWLHRVACRAALRARVQAGRRRALEQNLAVAMARRRDRDDTEGLASAVHAELDRLPDRYRVPIVLCYLEGRTCEEAARHVGCPVGTIGSRLARGRDQLRDRLARRGFAPAVGTLLATLDAEARAGALPPALVESTARLASIAGAGGSAAGASSAAAARLADDLLRSFFMAKLVSAGAVTATAISVGLLGGWTLRAALTPQDSLVAAQAPAPAPRDKVKELYPFMNDPERQKDAVYVEFGNMRPVVKEGAEVLFQSRMGILYKDGTAKLWDPRLKDPVAPALSHKGPIKELTFFDQSTLLITLSADSIKVWNALTGEFRKELDGQVIRPMWLSFAPSAGRFVTISSDRKAVTVWDAARLDPVSVLRVDGADQRLDAGLSGDGRTAALFRYGEDASAQLWDVASGRTFATLRLPSPSVAGIFIDGGNALNKDAIIEDGRFWQLVRSLAPTAASKGN